MNKPVQKRRFIAYYRVSTARQGRSGLGLDAQKKAVFDYLGGRAWELIGEFTENESGKNPTRPQLQRALVAARQGDATVVIAKMDRLGRRASYVLNLLDHSGVRFVFAEMPDASDLEIGIRAVVAQEEGRAISERTRLALAAAKRRGTKLGTYGKVLARENKRLAMNRARQLSPVIAELRAEGITSVRGITDALNARGIPTARPPSKWHVQTVHSLLKRIGT